MGTTAEEGLTETAAAVRYADYSDKELASEAAGHRELMVRAQGRAQGWDELLEHLRDLAAAAFRRGEDKEAHQLRDLASALSRDPKRMNIDAESSRHYKAEVSIRELLKERKAARERA